MAKETQDRTLYRHLDTGQSRQQKCRGVLIRRIGGHCYKAEVILDTSYDFQSSATVWEYIDGRGFELILAQQGREVPLVAEYYTLDHPTRGTMTRSGSLSEALHLTCENLMTLAFQIAGRSP